MNIKTETMKRFFLTLSLMIAVALTANAGNLDYLTVQKSDGTMVSFRSSGLTITFSGGNMIVTQSGTPTTLPLSALSKMFFSDNDVSGIKAATQARTSVEAGEVFDLQGRRVATQMRLTDMQGKLPKGIYVVKNGDATVKVTVK